MKTITRAQYDHLEPSEKNAYDAWWNDEQQRLRDDATENHMAHQELGERNPLCLDCQAGAK